MVIQSPIGKNVEIAPYGGSLATNSILFSNNNLPSDTTNTLYASGNDLFWQSSPVDIDCYNFYIKYPYIQNSIQEQLVGFSGTVISVVTSCVSGSSGTNIRINKEGSEICSIANIDSIPKKVTNLNSVHVNENYPLQLDVLSVQYGAQDLKVQVKVKRN
jgi:hypothetical protein